jgi:hypothetical protein
MCGRHALHCRILAARSGRIGEQLDGLRQRLVCGGCGLGIERRCETHRGDEAGGAAEIERIAAVRARRRTGLGGASASASASATAGGGGGGGGGVRHGVAGMWQGRGTRTRSSATRARQKGAEEKGAHGRTCALSRERGVGTHTARQSHSRLGHRLDCEAHGDGAAAAGAAAAESRGGVRGTLTACHRVERARRRGHRERGRGHRCT